MRFDPQFAQCAADDFVRHLLIDGLQVRHVVIGDDFHFGRGREGTVSTLTRAGERHGFTVESYPAFLLGGERVSSTRIRQALAQGDMQLAYELLGRPYTVCGRVGYGQQRGRTIGFPTANIALHRLKSPISGVFAVYLHGLHDHPLPGIANLGIRPTVDGKSHLLEVHLFDINEMFYGQYVEIEFVKKIREEQRFDSFSALKIQIEQDVIQAKQALLP
jgi:riboflavin kinase / FMN adenylyltransferase